MTKKPALVDEHAPLILVVDDFEDNRSMYVEYLQFHGFRVAEAVNGEEAVERASSLMPLAVVMDLSLPVMDGWEATRRIKADARTKDIRVLALSGHAESAHEKRALEAGCDDFLAKPCLPQDLLAKLREHLDPKLSSAAVTGAPGLDSVAKRRRNGKP